MNWQDISALQNDGQDIESKTMTHRNLSQLSVIDLNFEVSQSKKCLSDLPLMLQSLLHSMVMNGIMLLYNK
jgi:hypothetical protein